MNDMTGKNEVSIDQAALEREAAAVDLGEPPPVEGAAPGVDQGAPGEAGQAEPDAARIAELAAGAEPFLHGVVAMLHASTAPAWHLDPAKHAALAKSGAYALALWFPHELPPKYVALVGVAGVAWSIAQDNRDPRTGAYKPRHVTKPSSDAGDPAAAE